MHIYIIAYIFENVQKILWCEVLAAFLGSPEVDICETIEGGDEAVVVGEGLNVFVIEIGNVRLINTDGWHVVDPVAQE